MLVENKYNIGDVVFLLTDIDQVKRIITGIIIRPNSILYYVSCGSAETLHYDLEIILERNYAVWNWNKSDC